MEEFLIFLLVMSLKEVPYVVDKFKLNIQS
jgi:hypothetical protein